MEQIVNQINSLHVDGELLQIALSSEMDEEIRASAAEALIQQLLACSVPKEQLASLFSQNFGTIAQHVTQAGTDLTELNELFQPLMDNLGPQILAQLENI